MRRAGYTRCNGIGAGLDHLFGLTGDPPQHVKRGRKELCIECAAAFGFVLGALTAFAGCGGAIGARDTVRISLSDAHVIGASKLENERSRAPVLVRYGDRLWLHHLSIQGERRSEWIPGGELGPAMAVQRTSSARIWIDWVPDELDLTQLPGVGLRVSSSRWRNGRLLDAGEPIGWCPSLDTDASGSPHLVFDRHDSGDYDVIYRAPDDHAPGNRDTRLAGSHSFEADATIAVGDDGRVIVAWDEGSTEFGHGGGLHAARQIRLGSIREAEFFPLALPDDLLEGALGRASEGFSMAELPRLVIDDAGVLWFFYRAMARWNRIETDGKRGSPDTGSNRRVVWEWRVAALSDESEGWSPVTTLPLSDGAGYDGLAVIPLPGAGVAVCYESDGRIGEFPRAGRWEEPVAGAARLIALELSMKGGAPELATGTGRATGRIQPASATLAPDPDPELVPDGWKRMWGDLHRHSDLSRCKMDEDGNQLAQYRYAIDIGGLDFVALTEHYQHLTPGHWDYALEMVERFNRPGSLATLFGFEQAQTDGHRNLYCADPDEAGDAPFRDWTPRRRWVPFPASSWVAIPHQLADPKVLLQWPRQRGGIESMVEIYQSRRGSYFSREDPLRAFHAARSHPHAVDYLKDGKRFGVVAASDHVTTGGAYTAVYVREKNREELFRGLQSRRSYAATAKIALDVQLGSLMFGGEGPVEREAALCVRVAAGSKIARVDVLRNGELAHTWSGRGDEKWLTVRLGGGTRDSRLQLRLEDAEWIGRPTPFRNTDASNIISTENGVRIDGELGAYGECGLSGRIKLGAHPVLHLERERNSDRIALRDEQGMSLEGPVMSRVGTVRAEVRLDPEVLGVDRLDDCWSPGDWKHGDWVQVIVVRMDGEMAWSSPIWVKGKGW